MHQPRIVAQPDIMMGKPVIAGTRITVEHIVEQLAGGRTVDDILAAHPHITVEDIQTALSYATQSTKLEQTLY